MVDLNFKLIVAGIAALLVALLTFLRFCGDLSLPPKPPPPKPTDIGRVNDVMTATDGRAAGLPTPDPAGLARAFPFQVDTKLHTLKIGDSLEAAGLSSKLGVTGSDGRKSVVLDIENLGRDDLAYQVVTRPGINPA